MPPCAPRAPISPAALRLAMADVEALKKKVAAFAEKAGLKANAADAMLRKMLERQAAGAPIAGAASAASEASASGAAASCATPPSTPVARKPILQKMTPLPSPASRSEAGSELSAVKDSPQFHKPTKRMKADDFIQRVSDMAFQCGLSYEGLLAACGVSRDGLKLMDNLSDKDAMALEREVFNTTLVLSTRLRQEEQQSQALLARIRTGGKDAETAPESLAGSLAPTETLPDSAPGPSVPVSYTHLTLPTIRSV